MNAKRIIIVVIALAIVVTVSFVGLRAQSAGATSKVSLITRVEFISSNADHPTSFMVGVSIVVPGAPPTGTSVENIPVDSSPRQINDAIKQGLIDQGFLAPGQKLVLFGAAE
jgi:hypothetical protein